MKIKIFLLISLFIITLSIISCGGNEASIPPLQPYGALSGTVYSLETKEPVAGATVNVEKVSDTETTDGYGKFYFSKVPSGRRKITITKEGYKEYTDTINIQEDTENTYEAYIQIAYGTLYGIVTDATGALVIGANIVVGGSYHSVSDTNGYYEIVDIPVGSYSLSVTASGYLPYTSNIEIQEGSTNLDIQLTLNLGTVAGVVTDKETGAIISGAIVSIGGGYTATTDSNGYYEISNIPLGTYPITVMVEGYTDYTGSITVEAGYQVNNIELEAPASQEEESTTP